MCSACVPCGQRDITARTTTVECPEAMATRNSQFDVSDIEGAAPGWKPPFRSHVGVRLRDPGLNVADITGGPKLRRPHTACETTQPPVEQLRQVQATESPTTEASQTPSEQPPSPDSAAGPSDSQRLAVHFANTLGGLVRLAQAGSMHGAVGRTVERDVATWHSARIALANERLAASGAAEAVAQSLHVSDSGLKALHNACTRLDREGCGAITASEFEAAVRSSGIESSSEEIATLSVGLQNHAGLIAYGRLVKALARRGQAGRTPAVSTSASGRRPTSAAPALSSPTKSVSLALQQSTSAQRHDRPLPAAVTAAEAVEPSGAQQGWAAPPAAAPAYTPVGLSMPSSAAPEHETDALDWQGVLPRSEEPEHHMRRPASTINAIEGHAVAESRTYFPFKAHA